MKVTAANITKALNLPGDVTTRRHYAHDDLFLVDFRTTSRSEFAYQRMALQVLKDLETAGFPAFAVTEAANPRRTEIYVEATPGAVQRVYGRDVILSSVGFAEHLAGLQKIEEIRILNAKKRDTQEAMDALGREIDDLDEQIARIQGY